MPRPKGAKNKKVKSDKKSGGYREGSGRKNKRNAGRMSITFNRDLAPIVKEMDITGYKTFSEKIEFMVREYIAKGGNNES